MTWDPHLMPRALATCFATLVACALVPGAAGASVSLSSVSLTPSTTQAGGHPDVTIDTVFGLNPDTDDVKSVRVVLPQGLVGNPQAADACSEASFRADACPAGSKVGTTTASAVVTVPPGVDMPQDVPGDVYSLQPRGSEPARLGVVLRPQAVNLVSLPKIFLESAVTSDARLRNEVRRVPLLGTDWIVFNTYRSPFGSTARVTAACAIAS